MIQLIISSKVSFWFAKEITLQQRNSGALTKEIRYDMLCKQKRTQLPIITIDFAVENKTRRQLTNHSVTGVLCSNLDLNTAGEKPSLSVLVEIFVCTQLMQLVEKKYSHIFHVLNLRCIF